MRLMKRRDFEENFDEFVRQLSPNNFEGVRLTALRSMILMWIGDKHMYSKAGVNMTLDDAILIAIDNEQCLHIKRACMLFALTCAIHLVKATMKLVRAYSNWLLEAMRNHDVALVEALMHYYAALRDSYMRYEGGEVTEPAANQMKESDEDGYLRSNRRRTNYAEALAAGTGEVEDEEEIGIRESLRRKSRKGGFDDDEYRDAGEEDEEEEEEEYADDDDVCSVYDIYHH